jgi:hypothetical protein
MANKKVCAYMYSVIAKMGSTLLDETCLLSVLTKIYLFMLLLRFERRLLIPWDINGPLLDMKSLILYI